MTPTLAHWFLRLIDALDQPCAARAEAPSPVRRHAHTARTPSRTRVMWLPDASDPVLDTPTYLRRGVRIAGLPPH